MRDASLIACDFEKELPTATFDSMSSDRHTDYTLPWVSVVVPTHDRPEVLWRLLESLRHLSYCHSRLELNVVGGDHDRGRKVVQAFGESVLFQVNYRVVSNDVLHSASFKRNEGARFARGEILAFTDDDCVVHPDWIIAALAYFRSPDVGGVEGAVDVPRPNRPTLTYRRSLRLSLPEGYQTCNMLYRKSVFEECGGFDLAFPYYLEDTDLAYTVLERGYRIPFAAGAVVSHPVPPGNPLKMFTTARTVEQLPYLFRKHAKSRVKLKASATALTKSHYAFLSLYGGVLLLFLVQPRTGAISLGIGLSTLMTLHLVHDFWGLRTTPRELALTALCLPIIPVVRLFYFLKGLVLSHVEQVRARIS